MARPRRRPNQEGKWQCSKCKLWKSEAEFFRHGVNSSGLQSQCKDCMQGFVLTEELYQERLARRSEKDWRSRKQVWNQYVQLMVEFGVPDHIGKPPWEIEGHVLPEGLLPM